MRRPECLLRLFSIEPAVLNRFRKVCSDDALGAGEIRNRARDFENAVIAACREPQPRNRLFEQHCALFVRCAVFVDLAWAEPRIVFVLTPKHAGARFRHTLSNDTRDDSPAPAFERSYGDIAGTSIWMSMRSSSGPEIFLR